MDIVTDITGDKNMETRILRQFLDARYPESDIVIDIGLTDIFNLRDINIINMAHYPIYHLK